MRARILVRGLNAQKTGNIHMFSRQRDLFSEREHGRIQSSDKRLNGVLVWHWLG